MKRCPECGRDYYDDTLSFCLNDGSELVYGLELDQPATAILHETDAPGEAATRAQIHTTDHTAVMRSGITDIQEAKGFNKRLILAPVALAVIVLSGFFGYRYLTQAKQIESIAVMPFVNDSRDPGSEFLSDGMAETLISSLTQLPNLNVKARSAVFRYKGSQTDTKTIGKELNVQAILTGHMTQRGDQLTLSLELVDVATENAIWSQRYDRKQSDLVALQGEIARDVSAKLKSKLSGVDEAIVTKTSTTNPEAYQAYLKGRYFWNRRTSETLKKAIEQFKVAIDRDPNYAMAYVGLAECYVILNEYSGVPLDETVPQAKSFAERAIAIDEKLAEPHATLGAVHEYLWNWTEAEREYKRAIELNPNYATAFHWYANFLRGIGRFDEGFAMMKRAYEIDPLSSVIHDNFAVAYQSLNDYDACIEHSLKVIELDPDFSSVYTTLGTSYLKVGRTAEGMAALQKSVELSNRAAGKISYLGYAYGLTGKRAEAIALVKELEEKYTKKEATAKNVAAVYVGLGDKDKAFEWLEIGFRTKSDILYLKWETPFEPLRDDPRFKDLMKRMGLPE